MKKLFTIVIILMLSVVPVLSAPQLKDYAEFDIPSGTFVQVISLQEISTAYNDEMDELKFVSTGDIFMFEHVILPRGTTFFGYIEKKNEPVIGTNATMKIFLNKLVLPDGYELPLKGYIYHANDNTFGGEMTDPEKYIKVPHYHRGIAHNFMGVMQYRPGLVRKMGEHVSIASGADLLVVLVAPIHVTRLPQKD